MEHSIKKMKSLMSMQPGIRDSKSRELNRENQAFHEVYLSRCGNLLLIETVRNLKLRFYVVPHALMYLHGYESQLFAEHCELLELFKKRDAEGAAVLLEERHWSWEQNRRHILESYFPTERQAVVE
jgi:DNA-binding GntR family transcriptional regulator